MPLGSTESFFFMCVAFFLVQVRGERARKAWEVDVHGFAEPMGEVRHANQSTKLTKVRTA